MDTVTVGRVEFSRASEWSDLATRERSARRAAEARMAELEAEVAALRAPEAINPRALYSRLVGKLMTHWAALYPMAEWTDPETAAGRIADEVRELRRRAE